MNDSFELNEFGEVVRFNCGIRMETREATLYEEELVQRVAELESELTRVETERDENRVEVIVLRDIIKRVFEDIDYLPIRLKTFLKDKLGVLYDE